MPFAINERVSWVGKIDWELRKFHGEELSTNRGTSFNSYLVRDEKNVLIDSVWTPFTGEFIDNLKSLIDLNDIDYVICNHGEPDHSGALGHLMQLIPDTPIYCTANGAKSLKGQYHKDWNFQTVKTGDKLNIGSRDLIFIEAPMLHWPDTMMTYMTGDNILFSNDIFGQHYASEFMYDDLVNKDELDFEALKYYANIVAPFSSKAIKKLEEVKAMDLTIDMICPAHGIIFRKYVAEIFDKTMAWASGYSEDQITVVYDTMYKSTRRMAEAMVEGIREAAPGTEVKLYRASTADQSDVLTEIFRSKAVCIGSPNINATILSSVAGLMDEVKSLNLKGKKAAAFTSYGWSPASLKLLNTKLEEAGFEVFGKGIKVQWKPDAEALESCRAFAREFAAKL